MRVGCRGCGGELRLVADLGEQPVSGFVGEVRRAPLEVVRCRECRLVQLGDTVSRDSLYREHYWYRSGSNPEMVSALSELVKNVKKHVKTRGVWVDIGANDGTLLSHVGDSWTRIGFEPAPNLAEECSAHATKVYCRYFTAGVCSLEADVVTSVAMLYDLDDPRGFIRDVASVLRPGGLWCVQLMDLAGMVDSNSIDNLCHEHVTYPTGRHIAKWASGGLGLVDWSTNQTNGNSLRMIFRKGREPKYAGGDEDRSIVWFVQRGLAQLEATRVTLVQLKRRGARIAALGAGTKGNLLLSLVELGPELIDFVGDVNPDKFGKKTVTGIPIVPEDEVTGGDYDVILVLPWHFRRTFREKLTDYVSRGGAVIFPLPRAVIETVNGSEPLQ